MIKIVRENIDEIKHFKEVSYKGDKPYHKIEVEYTDGVLYITKTTNYLWGHGNEGMNKISIVSNNVIIFKTHDIKKLTPELEKECVKKLKEHLKNLIDENQSEIDKLYRCNDHYEDRIKDINKYFRIDKLNKIV